MGSNSPQVSESFALCLLGSDLQVAPDGPCVHVPWRGSRWVVAVACTTLKGGRAEWLVEKLTELGAFMMVPLVTQRSQVGRGACVCFRAGESILGYCMVYVR